MQDRTRFGLITLIGAAALAAACSDDGTTSNPGVAGSGTVAGGGAAPVAGDTSQGGTTAGTGAAAGMGGTGTGGVGGGMAGSGGTGGSTAGTAGTGGTAVVPQVDPMVFLIDNVRLRLKGSGNEGGAGGEGGAMGGAGGDASTALGGDGAGGAMGGAGNAMGGAGNAMGGAGDAMGGAGGAGDEPTLEPGHDFALTFDADLQGLAKNSPGFSPGPGGSVGPEIFSGTTFEWVAEGGNPGGAAKASIPFTVTDQQTDSSAPLAAAANLHGYELVMDIKLAETGDYECGVAWVFVYGATSGYANDASAEPSMGTTTKLTKDEWETVRLDLDGPYGYHSRGMTTPDDPSDDFIPNGVERFGVQLNTWNCE